MITKSIVTEDTADVSDMYTPLSVAKEEIWRRWNDKALRKKVEDILGDVPNIIKDGPKALLFRNIASPNFEFKRFVELSGKVELKPACIEYHHDKFCTRNQDKLHLGRLVLFKGKDKNGDRIVRHKKIIDLKREENQRFSDICTLDGNKLIDFHHKFLGNLFKEVAIEDLSSWLMKKKGKDMTSVTSVYPHVLVLFLCHGIFFESFFIDHNKDERAFTFEIIKPAFDEIKKQFGLKPLIVRLFLKEEEGDSFWQYYYDDEDIRKVAIPGYPKL